MLSCSAPECNAGVQVAQDGRSEAKLTKPRVRCVLGTWTVSVFFLIGFIVVPVTAYASCEGQAGAECQDYCGEGHGGCEPGSWEETSCANGQLRGTAQCNDGEDVTIVIGGCETCEV